MTKEEICDLAEKIAKQYNPEGLSPFPYEKIVEDKGDLKIYLVEDLPENISGATKFSQENNSFWIVINKNKPKTRQNFTIAHELGHYFLHQDIIKTEEVLVDDESSLDGTTVLFRLDASEASMIEIEANNFAAAMIMPTELVKNAWATLNNIEECARIFNVSMSAMSIRVERLGLI